MSESDGFQVRGRSVNVMGDCLRPADVNEWLDKEGASFRWNVDTTPSPAPLEPVNGLTGRPFSEALEQPAYQKTPEYQADYTRANKVLEEIEEAENQLTVWELASAGSVSELEKKEQKTTALKAHIVALKASIDTKKPPAPTVVAESASGGDEPWKEKARARAYEIIKRDREKDLYPSQMNIADEIAKEFRRDGVMGTDGKPLTGAYIKRWALTGISSAQSKLASTVTRWGK